MDTETLATDMVTIGNIRVAVTRADDKLTAAKMQVHGAFTALTHHNQNGMNTLSLTVEHLEFALQELEAIPWKQMMLDIRVLKGQLKKELKRGNK